MKVNWNYIQRAGSSGSFHTGTMTIRRDRCLGSADMKVTWEDLGCPDGPGTYTFKDGTINVGPQEMSIWIEHPGARFTVRSFRLWTGKPQYALGGYELPDERRNFS
jgi:hypothetical protein